jgi:hypothetical protein
MNLHEERIHDGRHAEMALNEVRHVVADMADQGALQWAGWLRDAMKRGHEVCLLCASEPKAEPAPPGPAATEEQNLVHALGGDRTAQTIAHTLTVHGHTLNAVRTMTYAELLAVPGIGGPSLARIRAALDGVPEPDAAAATRPGEAAIARVRAAVHIADDEDVTDWQRGYRACAVNALAALDQPAPGPAATQATKPGHVITIEGDPAAAHEAVRQMDADTTNPHTGLVVQPYRDHGEQKWVFRCWGTDDGCDGWLSLDHYSQQSATRARDRHVAEEHPNKEQLPTAADRVRVLHRRNENTGECEYCSFRDYPTYAVPYPCDTVRALDGQEQPS